MVSIYTFLLSLSGGKSVCLDFDFQDSASKFTTLLSKSLPESAW